jgi:hypothetical protein
MLDHCSTAVQLRDQPRRAAVGCRDLRQPRQRPQRHVPRSIDMVLALWSQDPPYNLKGQFWNISTARTHDARDRPGLRRQAAAASASAHRGDRRGAVLQGRHRGRGARLGPDLRQLPDAEWVASHKGKLHRGLRAGRAHARPGELARGQEHLRRRRSGTGARLCYRSDSPYLYYYSQPRDQAEEERAAQPVQGRSVHAGRCGDARLRHATGW